MRINKDKMFMEIRVSVRGLVEFILRSGDIDRRKTAGADGAMQEGSRIHRMIQKRMGSNYQAEVPMRYVYDAKDYQIIIEGRADGVIVQEDITTIDEIKGTYKDLERMKEPVSVHLAQAKCYAYFYAVEHNLNEMKIQMTYCHLETEEIRYFYFQYTFEELHDWFSQVIEEYKKWADYSFAWQKEREQSIKQLEFPYLYRKGQKELITYVYQTIYHKKKLYIEAPTGVGKTLSTVFPAVKALGEGKGEKIFYLTAKTITRTVCENAFQLLRERGLKFKSVVLTARDKICFMEESQCDPVHCPYAKGHFDRVNAAMYELLTTEDSFSREMIEKYARKYEICPFEFCLDMSLFADGIIGDYNYAFDPHVYLKRFFQEGVKGEYLFLIDEAHNLVDRGREMYSATLYKEDFMALKKRVKDVYIPLVAPLDKCNKEFLNLKRECASFYLTDQIHGLSLRLNRLLSVMEDYLENHIDGDGHQEILELYFQVSHFMMIYELLDEHYVIYCEMLSDGRFMVKLLCVNPTKNLSLCMMRARSSILFSATLLPIQYYKKLLGAEEGDYEVYAESVFDPAKRGLFIGEDVTSKYTKRSQDEFMKIAEYIHKISSMKKGNYMVFFPSHAFLRQVYELFECYFYNPNIVECILQDTYMNEDSREDFLSRFERQDKTLIGFCVLGGIFSEGIDLKNDSLIGAIIVGTGLPQVCTEREILKAYFDAAGENGFDYAYRFPGMNKVQQAAGRVIRTSEDIGIVTLLDYRFLDKSYQGLFPREWKDYKCMGIHTIEAALEQFWKEMEGK